MKEFMYIVKFILVMALGMSIMEIRSINKKINTMDLYYDSLILDMYDAVIDKYEKDAFLVTVTTYNAVESQCDSDPNTTASGLKVRQRSKYVALSRDLLSEFPYGSLIRIENAGIYNGIYVVADCMSIKQFRTVDILLPPNKKHTKLKNAIIRYATKE